MPVRAVLNVVYALLVKDLDGKDREQFDNELYGFTAMNASGTRALFGVSGGGEG